MLYSPITNQEIDSDTAHDPGFAHSPAGAPFTDSPPSLLLRLEDLTLPRNAHVPAPLDINLLTQKPHQLEASQSPPTSSVSSRKESGLSSPLSFITNTLNTEEDQNAVIGQTPPDIPSDVLSGNSADISQKMEEILQNLANYISNMNKIMQDGGQKAYDAKVDEQITEKGWDMDTLDRSRKNRIRAEASRARQSEKDAIQKKGIEKIKSGIVKLVSMARRKRRNARKQNQSPVRQSLQVHLTEPELGVISTAGATEISSAEQFTPDLLMGDINSIIPLNDTAMPPIGQVFIVSSRSQSFDKHSTGDLLAVTTPVTGAAVYRSDDENLNTA